MTFDYETPDLRVSAHRFDQRETFVVSVQRRGQDDVRYCRSDSAFQQLLLNFESLKIRRSVTEQELATIKSGRVAYHRLRLVSAPPMEADEQVLIAQPNGRLLVEVEDAGYELTLTKQVVDQLARACRGQP